MPGKKTAVPSASGSSATTRSSSKGSTSGASAAGRRPLQGSRALASSEQQAASTTTNPRMTRRDKYSRRQQQPPPQPQQSHVIIDNDIDANNDPMQLLALAVELDARRRDAEALLQVPLEQARFYDKAQFALALDHLQRHTTSSSTERRRRRRVAPGKQVDAAAAAAAAAAGEMSSVSADVPVVALAPLVLSGLLAAIQQQQREYDNDTATATASTFDTATTTIQQSAGGDIGSDLVAACQTMRMRALKRLQRRKRRRQVLRVIMPILTIVVSIAMYRQYVGRIHYWQDTLHFSESCDNTAVGEYQTACREADASLWESFRIPMEEFLGQWKMTKDAIMERLLRLPPDAVAPLARHTALVQVLIAQDDLVRWNTTGTSNSKSVKSQVTSNLLGHMESPLRWLGETKVTSLVREAIYDNLLDAATKDLEVLDVGCGLGGLLYALLPNGNNASHNKFRYHGISISGAEVFHAKEFAKYYNVDMSNVTFAQKSFDSPLVPRSYNAIVAIESLSYSQAIDTTLDNLMQSLQSGGVFVLVTDVLSMPTFPGYISMPTNSAKHQPSSLASYLSWMKTLNKHNCTVQQVRDLGLEYELAGLTTLPLTTTRRLAWPRRRLLKTLRQLAYQACWFVGTWRGADRRMKRLEEHRVALMERRKKRKEQYWRVTTAYHMYVCTKH